SRVPENHRKQKKKPVYRAHAQSAELELANIATVGRQNPAISETGPQTTRRRISVSLRTVHLPHRWWHGK
ncbi:hypothetical protein, partial [Thiogranum longum]